MGNALRVSGLAERTELAGMLANRSDAGDSLQDNLWLIALLDWIRGPCDSIPHAVQRLSDVLDALEATQVGRVDVQNWWQALALRCDLATLLADYGFASRSAFVSEFFERLRCKLLPSTPETQDAGELFSQVFCQEFDAKWLSALDAGILRRLGELLCASEAAQKWRGQDPSRWHNTVLEALAFCTSQVRATGFSPELRLRMSPEAVAANPFYALASDGQAVRDAYCRAAQPNDPDLIAALERFRTRLDACSVAAASVYGHLDEYGISVNLVFQLRQLHQRVKRIQSLLECLVSTAPQTRTANLLAHLVSVGQERRSLRALLRSNTSLLATKVAERNSETGEHYITRTHLEYRDMLRKAAGGGAVMALTTAFKFAIVALGLSAFWGGLFAGLNYAISFVVVQLLHWTVATKQPAMTAPAMAARLKDPGNPGALGEFVDTVAHLVRSQFAAVVGNLALVAPCVWLISAARQMIQAQPLISPDKAEHVLHDLTLWGPTALFAAFTGVLLFSASIMAGWVENWFVLHRLESAVRHNPQITATLGQARAGRWAGFARSHVSGLTANIALGLMLGLVPAVFSFFGLGLEVRHVTLSTGQLAAAVAALGWPILSLPIFWWCMAGLMVTATLNIGVSFYLAFRVALRAHNVSGNDRVHIRQALWRRVRAQPLSFLWPPPPRSSV